VGNKYLLHLHAALHVLMSFVIWRKSSFFLSFLLYTICWAFSHSFCCHTNTRAYAQAAKARRNENLDQGDNEIPLNLSILKKEGNRKRIRKIVYRKQSDQNLKSIVTELFIRLQKNLKMNPKMEHQIMFNLCDEILKLLEHIKIFCEEQTRKDDRGFVRLYD